MKKIKLFCVLLLAGAMMVPMMAAKRKKTVVDREVEADSLAWVACYQRFPFLIRTAEDIERDSLEALANVEIVELDSADYAQLEAQEDSLAAMIDEVYDIGSDIMVWENGYGKVDKITYTDDRGREHTWLPGKSVKQLPQSLLLDYRVTAKGNLLSRRKPFTSEDDIAYTSKTAMMLYIATHRMWFPMSGGD
ncbi:MAG: hypothetical protein II683_04420 [Muribaculaceae bacterium]|nr:hypothetical protein [Muribaculaceae bacterium]